MFLRGMDFDPPRAGIMPKIFFFASVIFAFIT